MGAGRLENLGPADVESRPAVGRPLHSFANDVEVAPWQSAGMPEDLNNLQPRVGFAFQLNDRTVIRGGSGLYYGDAIGADFSFATGNAQIANIEYLNDGRANFALDPTNGQGLPTYGARRPLLCSPHRRRTSPRGRPAASPERRPA